MMAKQKPLNSIAKKLNKWYYNAMNRGMRSIFLGLGIFILFIGVVILFTSGGGKEPKPEGTVPKPLPDYASTDAVVSSTTEGEIVARENYREIKVIVGRDFRTLQVIKGYQGDVIKEKNYSNDESAYSQFLYALSYANFTKERGTDLPSEAGVCAAGNRYVFKLEEGGSNISRLWSSTCSGDARGSFGGKTFNVTTLFERQIPDYDDLTHRVNLN